MVSAHLHSGAADLNWKNPEVHEDFKKTLRFDRGVDGFRIDVAHGLAKDLDSKPLAEMDADCVFDTDNRNGNNPLWGPRRSARHLP